MFFLYMLRFRKENFKNKEYFYESRYNQHLLEKKIIEDAIDQYGTYAGNLWIVQGVGDVTVQTVREKVERFIATYGQAPVVLIDYLQLLASTDPRLSDKQATDKNVLELKRISHL